MLACYSSEIHSSYSKTTVSSRIKNLSFNKKLGHNLNLSNVQVSRCSDVGGIVMLCRKNLLCNYVHEKVNTQFLPESTLY